jgi:hypothetical protein
MTKRNALQQGGVVALASAVVAYGLTMFQVSEPHDWIRLILISIVLGSAVAIYTYLISL